MLAMYCAMSSSTAGGVVSSVATAERCLRFSEGNLNQFGLVLDWSVVLGVGNNRQFNF
jgi:hypothetical protein